MEILHNVFAILFGRLKKKIIVVLLLNNREEDIFKILRKIDTNVPKSIPISNHFNQELTDLKRAIRNK